MRPISVDSHYENEDAFATYNTRRPSTWARRASTFQRHRQSSYMRRPSEFRGAHMEEEEDDDGSQYEAPTSAANPLFTGFSFLPVPRNSVFVPNTSKSAKANRFSVMRPDSAFLGTQAPVPEKAMQLSNSYFKSRRIKEPAEKPWLNMKDPRRKWGNLLPLIGLVIGFGIAMALVWQGLGTIEEHDFCLILDDNFTTFDTSVWTKEAQVDGYGNGQFEETTVTDENVFVKDGALHILPTLQDATLIETNNTINLTATGVCTGTTWSQCVTSTNTTNGTIVNPVKSGRINTKKKAAIQYGRVEVTAQLPKGDWLWPAIWMLPVNETYGGWPLSGEIDIVESRGNNYTYTTGGNNIVSTALHWGPDLTNDAWFRTYKKLAAFHSTYSSKFYTFGLEWTPKYLYTYIDSRLAQVLYNKFNEPLWQRGDFPLADPNGTAFHDPWSQTGNDSTPFDQPFYLILNVAVGGNNGWFVDGKNGKPWVNKSPSERIDFWKARSIWNATWTSPEMIVKNVKMWQLKGYQGC